MRMKLNIYLDPHSHLTTIIIEPLWSILERSVLNRYPKPASLPELSQYLNEDWNSIPLNTVQYSYESIPRRIQAV
ncbi:DDE_3 domain-containing protein [Trichonephila clavipes]|nr:DDE_3 domain-containing protein [Trichonephila clavipes]